VQYSWIKLIDGAEAQTNDLLATVTESIAVLIHHHLSPLAGTGANVLVTGGGAHNVYLLKRLNLLASADGFSFHLPATEIINYKECALMAYLGYLTAHGKPYGLNEMTGAIRDSIGGAMFKALR
jgi:anhydro-N-acetylmuramic acid kinase